MMLMNPEEVLGVSFLGMILIVIFWICVGAILWPKEFYDEPVATLFMVGGCFLTQQFIRNFGWQILAVPCAIIIIIFLFYTFKDRI